MKLTISYHREARRRRKRAGNMFEKIKTENFPNLVREKVTRAQEAQRIPIKMNSKRLTPRHNTIKRVIFKDKERILKAAREKQLVTYKGAPKSLSTDFSREIL